MATQLLFYRNAVPVNAQRHKMTSVKAGDSFAFARNVNSVPLVASEFADAGAEMPIVFAGAGDNIVPTAILGATGSQNAFVSGEGKWGGRYVPAFVRRYPFVFSHETSDGQLVLHIDEEFEGCNTEDRGERLFDGEGNQTHYLKQVLRFLQDYQRQFNRTRIFCQRLMEHDLLRDMEAKFTLPNGERRQLNGFKTVDRDRLKALDESVLMTMLKTDELECVYLHLASLRHFASVAERSGASEAAEAPVEPAGADA
ncbi:multidrug transporter [Acuticoccus sediminis]|uniref:Multidrug transporter n=1 Tax=Acuticoccus sediminis TaxID=2184697 RepID=A0A8B2NUC5_9HYPH|nr:SapC family protein [Acuticoccus sediminis]RAI00895.1 multidrug transporter [Acuticoccus sediminis]